MNFLGWLIILIIILAVIVYSPTVVLAWLLANLIWIVITGVILIVAFIGLCILAAALS